MLGCYTVTELWFYFYAVQDADTLPTSFKFDSLRQYQLLQLLLSYLNLTQMLIRLLGDFIQLSVTVVISFHQINTCVQH